MIKRTIAICAVAAIALMGCAEPVEPNNDNGDDNNTSSSNNTTPTNTGNNTSTNNTTPDPCATVVCNTPPVNVCMDGTPTNYMNPGQCVEGECVYAVEEADACGQDELCEIDGSRATCKRDPNAPCPTTTDFEGQIGMDSDGGVFSTSDMALADDSGLQALVAQIKGLVDDGTITDDDDATADVDESFLEFEAGSEVRITGAMVTSVAFESPRDSGNFRRLTLQDKLAGIIVFFEGDVPMALKVGQKISFDVTAVQAFGANVPQIARMANITVDAEDQDVFVQERTGQAISIDDWSKLVRVTGKITEITIPNCGGSNVCYAFEHGEEGSTQTITLRSQSDFIEVGECGSYVGPVSSFPGPFDDGAGAQLDATNFGWYRGPFRSMN